MPTNTSSLVTSIGIYIGRLLLSLYMVKMRNSILFLFCLLLKLTVGSNTVISMIPVRLALGGKCSTTEQTKCIKGATCIENICQNETLVFKYGGENPIIYCGGSQKFAFKKRTDGSCCCMSLAEITDKPVRCADNATKYFCQDQCPTNKTKCPGDLGTRHTRTTLITAPRPTIKVNVTYNDPKYIDDGEVSVQISGPLKVECEWSWICCNEHGENMRNGSDTTTLVSNVTDPGNHSDDCLHYIHNVGKKTHHSMFNKAETTVCNVSFRVSAPFFKVWTTAETLTITNAKYRMPFNYYQPYENDTAKWTVIGLAAACGMFLMSMALSFLCCVSTSKERIRRERYREFVLWQQSQRERRSMDRLMATKAQVTAGNPNVNPGVVTSVPPVSVTDSHL